MDNYRLTEERYVSPTPAGAYYAASSKTKDAARQFLFSLMKQPQSVLLTEELLTELTGEEVQESLDLLHRIHNLGWVKSGAEPHRPPNGTIEEILPELLSTLSCAGKALLADQEGFYLATHGFSHETAEELSALSADIASLHQRHSGLLEHNMGIGSSAWAIVNASGDSHLGFWPLFIGKHRFTLILSGLPSLNQAVFTNLVWSLSKRYVQDEK